MARSKVKRTVRRHQIRARWKRRIEKKKVLSKQKKVKGKKS